jgi:hypothetical protein
MSRKTQVCPWPYLLASDPATAAAAPAGAAAATSGAAAGALLGADVAVAPPVRHVLSLELQVYFNKVRATCAKSAACLCNA